MMFQLISIPIIILLIIYNLRRLIFSFANILFNGKEKTKYASTENQVDLPEVLVLLPCHDEELMILQLSKSISNLNYPKEKIKVVFINDGSQDNTKALIESITNENPGFAFISMVKNLGKAAVLNEAINMFAFGEIIAIFDADHRPLPNAVLNAVGYFSDMSVAGVSGRILSTQPTLSPSSYYSSVENDVHQMVTMRAKDRLHLAPAILGSNCYYRRSYLVDHGKFREGALLEDTDLTLTFTRAGYITRFAEDVVAYHQVPITIRDYLKQHIRWSRGFHDVSRAHILPLLFDKKLSIILRVELCLFSTGYLDRIALTFAFSLWVISILNNNYYFPLGILIFALVTPMIQIVILFLQLRVPISMWIRLPLIPIFYIVDIFSALSAMIYTIFNRPRIWSKVSRARAGL